MKHFHYAAGGAAAAAAAAIAQATKASGAIVKMQPDQFQKLLNKSKDPIVVIAEGGFLKKKINYLTCYRGLFFYTSSGEKLMLPSSAEVIAAGSIWIPR